MARTLKPLWILAGILLTPSVDAQFSGRADLTIGPTEPSLTIRGHGNYTVHLQIEGQGHCSGGTPMAAQVGPTDDRSKVGPWRIVPASIEVQPALRTGNAATGSDFDLNATAEFHVIVNRTFDYDTTDRVNWFATTATPQGNGAAICRVEYAVRDERPLEINVTRFAASTQDGRAGGQPLARPLAFTGTASTPPDAFAGAAVLALALISLLAAARRGR